MKRTRYIARFTWHDLSYLLGASRDTLRQRASRWELNLNDLAELLEFIHRSQQLPRGAGYKSRQNVDIPAERILKGSPLRGPGGENK